ncbi:MAG: hypothetical protein WDW38_005508 [Sanguina aurantia]
MAEQVASPCKADTRSPLRPSHSHNVHAGSPPATRSSLKLQTSSPAKSAVKQGNLTLAAFQTGASPKHSTASPSHALPQQPDPPSLPPPPTATGSNVPQVLPVSASPARKGPTIQGTPTPPNLAPAAPLPPTPYRFSPQPPPLTKLADIEAATPAAATPGGPASPTWGSPRHTPDNNPPRQQPASVAGAGLLLSPPNSTPASAVKPLPVAGPLPPTPYQHPPLPPPLTVLADLEVGTPTALTPGPTPSLACTLELQGAGSSPALFTRPSVGEMDGSSSRSPVQPTSS